MRCAYVEKQGSADTLIIGEQPDPVMKSGQVLVKVKATSVNPIDTYLRAGSIPMPVTLPFIPGCDFAGEIVATADDVVQFQFGDRVWGSNQSLFGRQGSMAELLAVDAGWVYPTPAGVADQVVAAGALVGITAHLGLFRDARLQPGQWVFVNGGTGGVGSVVVQFAKAAGAHVITTVGSQEKVELAKQLGADVVINYHDADLDQQIRNAAQANGGLDVFWETLRTPNVERAIQFMKPGGKIVLMAGREAQIQFTLGPFYANDMQLLGFAMFNASQADQRTAATQMNQWLVEGKWKPVIGEVFSLQDAAAAHQLQENKTLVKSAAISGKIVVEIN